MRIYILSKGQITLYSKQAVIASHETEIRWAFFGPDLIQKLPFP